MREALRLPSSPLSLFPSSPLPLFPSTLLLALCSMPITLFAQYFSLGSDPASVRWNQVKTPHFKVIYPVELDSQAIYLANALEFYRGPGSSSLEVKTGRWPVILHNRTVLSNAYVPYAPKRIEMVTAPPQDNYAQDWIDGLVVHEFRHAVQYTSVNRGLTKGLGYLFGQQAVAGVLGIFAPFWFIEGDAVVAETANSRTGRGRLPSFEMKLRAQFVERGIYTYDKAYNGSYRDFTPNHYELGYLLVGHTRTEFGKETWSRVMRKTGNNPLMLVPFSNTLYKETGFGKSSLYDHITTKLERSWKESDENLIPTPYVSLLKSSDRFYTSRTQPAILPDGSIIARRTSIEDITRIVIIDTAGKEKPLLNPGYMIDESLSAVDGYLCWAELKNDPRWDLRSYSVIMLYDLQNGHTRQITRQTRYFAPALSQDGKAIAVAEADDTNHFSLLILDATNGEIIYRLPAPGNYFLSYPAWSPDGTEVAMILTRDEGKCLAVADIKSGRFHFLLPFTNNDISKPAWSAKYIFFTGAFTGIDNIFAFDTDTKKLFQVTSARFGATDAAVSPDGRDLIYANYTSGGYEIVTAALNPELWQEWDPVSEFKYELADQLAEQEDFIFDSAAVPDSAYEIKPYRKALNLFNFHSWAPLSVDIDNTDANPGLTLMSQNLLGTSFTSLGYEYNLNEETGKYFLNYSYEGLYPVFDFDVDYGLRRGMHQDTIYYDFDELNIGIWVRVPLNWNIKSWFVGFQPFAGYSYKFRKMNPGMELRFRQDRFHSLNTKLFFYAQSRMSERDLYPRWGQSFDLNYRQTLLEADSASSVFAAETQLYFPGFTKHHSFNIYAGYQYRFVDNYYYSGLIHMPRGYSGIYYNEVLSIAAAYEFPVFCPDWHIGPLLYLKRLKAAVFYDYALAFDPAPDKNYYSTGLDLTIDFHLFRHFAPLEAGLRTIYFPETNTVGFEFLYSLNLNY